VTPRQFRGFLVSVNVAAEKDAVFVSSATGHKVTGTMRHYCKPSD
jgi:hypothetical protein